MSIRTYTFLALGFYLALGAIDFIDTFVLIRDGDGIVYESNPVAATWLNNFGWKGLAVFKAATMIVLGTTVLLIQKRSPRIAAVLATTGCLCVFAVAIYSRHLLTAIAPNSPG